MRCEECDVRYDRKSAIHFPIMHNITTYIVSKPDDNNDVGGRRSPAVACWASDHWVASSNPLRGKFRH